MVQLYIRLPEPSPHGTYGIEVLILQVSPDLCLEEAVVLFYALHPAYMSITVLDDTTGKQQWQIGK